MIRILRVLTKKNVFFYIFYFIFFWCLFGIFRSKKKLLFNLLFKSSFFFLSRIGCFCYFQLFCLVFHRFLEINVSKHMWKSRFQKKHVQKLSEINILFKKKSKTNVKWILILKRNEKTWVFKQFYTLKSVYLSWFWWNKKKRSFFLASRSRVRDEEFNKNWSNLA